MPPAPATKRGEAPEGDAPAGGERELIVIAQPDAGLRSRLAGPASVTGADVGPLAALMAAAGAKMVPLFGAATEERAAALRDVAGVEPRPVEVPAGPPIAPPSLYHRVEAPDARLDDLAAKLRRSPLVQAAYVKPPAAPAHRAHPLNAMLPRAEDAPPLSPSFLARQLYLDSAPGGVDARHAWTLPGGRGAGVRIIDVEGAWRFTHEDLTQNQGGVVGGTPLGDLAWRNHGTAVVGVIGGDDTSFGVTGICPEANMRAISHGGLGSAAAIRRAADLLGPGDIILVELHRPGPRATGAGQEGYIAVEWWPDDYDAIRYAVSRGVIVVEAAGNGAEDLDAAAYDAPDVGFPASWSNPFRRGARDSGAILVGAGAPPPGTHGRDVWGPDRSRLDFSNFGAAVDAQGWGREVTTCGYGDLQGGVSEDLWYTDEFSGTSSASPVIVGVLGCAQGVRRARAEALLTPATARALLRSTGSPQQDAPGRPAATQRIGNRPSLRQMLGGGAAGDTVVAAGTVPLYRYWSAAAGDHFYTTSLAELGNGGSGYVLERVQARAYARQEPGTVPLYRYWSAAAGDHFYTTDRSELGDGAHGWLFESVQCYVLPAARPGALPLYRYWNPDVGDHFYTTSFAELGSGRRGWSFERIQCYLLPNPPSLRPDATGAAADPAPAGEPAAADAVPATFALGGAGGSQDSFTVEPGARGGGAITINVNVGPRRR